MEESDFQFTVDFSDAYNDETEGDVAELVSDAIVQIPRIVPDASVVNAERRAEGIMGLEWLPALEIMVSAPALLLLLREIGRIISEKLGTKSQISIIRRNPDGSESRISLETSELNGRETLETIRSMLSSKK